jgi:hypothetical protein
LLLNDVVRRLNPVQRFERGVDPLWRGRRPSRRRMLALDVVNLTKVPDGLRMLIRRSGAAHINGGMCGAAIKATIVLVRV